MADQAHLAEHTFVPAEGGPAPSPTLRMAVVILIMAGTLGALFGGPALGHHEALVAQCARTMRLSGD